MPLILRGPTGRPLTNSEVDGNFTFVNDKADAAQGTATTAQNTANSAQNAADNAVLAAGNAVGVANSALSTVGGLQSQLDDERPFVFTPYNFLQNPGRYQHTFTGVLSPGGVPSAKPKISNDTEHNISLNTTAGLLLRLQNGGSVSTRDYVVVDNQDVAVSTAVSHASGSPVIDFGVLVFASDDSLIATEVVASVPLAAANGVASLRFTASRVARPGVDLVLPGNAVHIAPFVRLQPGSGTANVHLLGVERSHGPDTPKTAPELSAAGLLSPNILPTHRPGRPANLFNVRHATYGKQLQADGSLVDAPGWFTSEYMPVFAGLQITWPAPPATVRRVVGYDADYNIVSSATYGDTFTPTDPEIRWFRITHQIQHCDPRDFMVVRGNALPGSYVPFAANEAASLPLAGRSIIGLGDSITWGFAPPLSPAPYTQMPSWLPLVAHMLGADRYYNWGINGSALSYFEPPRDPMTRRYAGMPDDADVIVMMGGINDALNPSTLGSMGDTTDLTVYGALDVLAQGLLSKYRYGQGVDVGQNKVIVWCTPTRVLNRSEPGNLDPRVPPICEAIKEVGEKYSIPVFDAYNLSGITPELFLTQDVGGDLFNPLVTDGIHPRQEGHVILARAIAGFLRGVL